MQRNTQLGLTNGMRMRNYGSVSDTACDQINLRGGNNMTNACPQRRRKHSEGTRPSNLQTDGRQEQGPSCHCSPRHLRCYRPERIRTPVRWDTFGLGLTTTTRRR